MGPLCPIPENHSGSGWEIRGWWLTVLCFASADHCSLEWESPRAQACRWVLSDGAGVTQRSLPSKTSRASCPKIITQTFCEKACGVSLIFGVGGCGSGATPSWALEQMTSQLKGRNNYVHLTGSLCGCPAAEKASGIDNVLKSLTLKMWNRARVPGCEHKSQTHFWDWPVFQGQNQGSPPPISSNTVFLQFLHILHFLPGNRAVWPSRSATPAK